MSELLTPRELAAQLKLHPTTVLVMAREKVIPSIKLTSRVVRFDPVEVQRVLDSRTTAACASN